MMLEYMIVHAWCVEVFLYCALIVGAVWDRATLPSTQGVGPTVLRNAALGAPWRPAAFFLQDTLSRQWP